MAEFLVVGGGVIGLMLARELAQAGRQVKLVERKQCAREASWAGGGIVSPLYPWRYKPAVTALATWSQSSYVHLAQDLLEETGIDPELRQKGMFMVAVEDEEQALAWADEYKRPLSRVEGDFLYQKEANLAPGHQSALWMPEVASIRNPRLGQSLRRSAQLNDNIELIEETEITGFIREGDEILGVQTTNGEVRAERTILATGAWSGDLLALLNLKLPVEPVKGQMMVFNAKPGLINRVVLQGGRYLIPRNDGRILVGSTLEREGFNKETSAEAFTSLHKTALEICPALANYEVEHHWAGLRPGSPEGVPYIGAVPGLNNLYTNVGQYRNGLVLAPASTRLLADMLLGREPIINPEPYQLAGRIESL